MAAPYQTTRKDNEKNTQVNQPGIGYEDAYAENETFGYSATEQKNQTSTINTEPEAVSGEVKDIVVADHPIDAYNWLYESPNSLVENRSKYLKIHNEDGVIKAFRVLKISNNNYPWIYVGVKIDGEISYGYVHFEITQKLLPEIVVRNKNVSNTHSVIKTKDGANLYKTPGGEKLLNEPIAFNEEVFVINVDAEEWAYVKYKEHKGYVNINRVNTGTPMPGTGAKLYKIWEGDTLEEIIKANYSLSKEDDRRFYANALLHINNPQNQPGKGIYVKDQFDFFSGITISYDRFHVNEGYLIWLPQKAYVESLKRIVNSGSYKEELINKAHQLRDSIISTVDKFWPVNWGAFYDMQVGATFGYPIGGDIQGATYFYRKDEDTIALKKFGRFAIGLDTGVSAGIFIGKSGSKKGDKGLGASAGGDLEAKQAAYSQAEYEFPIKDDDAILSALMLIFAGDNMAINLGALFLDILAGTQLNPMHYMTKSKLAFGVELQANAGATGGIKKAGTDNETEAYTHKGSSASDKQADNISGTFLQAVNPLNPKVKLIDLLYRNLNIGAEALVRINPKFGLELSRTLQHDGGKVSVAQHQMDIFVEVGAEASLEAALPFLGKLGPVFEKGLGLKMTFTAKEGEDWGAPTFSFYSMSGEMDYYAGSASEDAISLGTDLSSTVSMLRDMKDEDFIALVKNIKFTRRLMVGSFMNRTAKLATQKENDQKHSQKPEYSHMLVSSDAYLDVVVDFGKVHIDVLRDITRLVSESFAGETLTDQFLNGLKAIMDWSKGVLKEVLKRDDKVDPTKDFLEFLKTAIQSDIFPSMVFHARIGAGFAAGAKLALGGKVRLSGSVAGGFVFEMDVKELLKGFIQGEEATKFMAQFHGENPTMDNDVATHLERHVKDLLTEEKN